MEGIMSIVAVVVGFFMGRATVTTKEPVKRSYKAITRPVQAYKEHKLTKEQEKEIAKYTAIMDNIENYDGTGANQKDVPL
jgi:hypothetical protein